MKRFLSGLLVVLAGFQVFANDAAWPEVTAEMKPGTRWWWLGSAVDKRNLTYNLEQYSRAGLGAVEITPIYGVQGNDANNIAYLSPEWMEMLGHTIAQTNRVGMLTDMSTGTGWPFGGPDVSVQDAASKLFIRRWKLKGGELFKETIRPIERNQQEATLLRLMAYSGRKVLNITAKVGAGHQAEWKVPAGEWEVIAAFNGKTFQKVKRAAPGGEGYVIDHFSKTALLNYLGKFEKAFSTSGTPWPHNFFNDSYEVYGADWTADLFEQFEQRRGYKLENQLPAFLSEERTELTARLIADYRETISDMLLENFTQTWSGWARKHGSKTRNQAHGSPANLIDIYAAVDVPECEGFGLSDFNIPGLRKDSLTRKNDSDLSMLKYASSAAHIAGRQLVSSETFTWLTEHFRTSLAQCKPDLDLMFVSGVNHMYFHGTPYSPREAAWPGWLFYATINMSPTNSIWKDAPALFQYITRSQSFLQYGQPDADFLMYLPVYDVWNEQKGRFLMFDIHSMEKRMPAFIEAVHTVYENGYDVDYISDRFILSTRVENGLLITEGGSVYKALVLPDVKMMPLNVMQHIALLIKGGATIVMLDRVPSDVPGLSNYKQNSRKFKSVVSKLRLPADLSRPQLTFTGKGRVITGKNNIETLRKAGVKSEDMITAHGLHMIRRKHNDGHHYFVSCLKDKPVNDWVKLAVDASSVLFYNPMNGAVSAAKVRNVNGTTEVLLQLEPGESVILKTFTSKEVKAPAHHYLNNPQIVKMDDLQWNLHFAKGEPAVSEMFVLPALRSWTALGNTALQEFSGTGVYAADFVIEKSEKAVYMLELGDVRESARVFVNNREAAVLWAVPYRCRIEDYLVNGKNTLRIEVTNLPANRIARYDRDKVKWRIFNEINMVDIQYRKSDYSNWQPVPGGLLGPVQLLKYPM